MKRRQGWSLPPCLWLVVAFAGLMACGGTKALSTVRLLSAFNDGATDSIPDPALGPELIAVSRARMTARRFLVRGFATQGISTKSPDVASWLEDPVVEGYATDLALQRTACILEESGHVTTQAESAANKAQTAPAPSDPCAEPARENPRTDDEGRTSDQPEPDPRDFAQDRAAKRFRCRLYHYLQSGGGAPSEIELHPGPVCAGHVPEIPGADQRSDLARLAASLEVAAVEVGRLVAEGLVSKEQAEQGFGDAMREAAAYLRSRRWRRSDTHPTIGIALKGGASSGTFTAGGAWRLLTLMQRYGQWRRRDPARDGEEVRFSLAAGTSAGAIVAAVIDIFNQSTCEIDPKAVHFRNEFGVPKDGVVTGHPEVCQEYARRLLATFFTRSDEASLYCIDRRFLLAIADDQKGLMDFTGLRETMGNYITERAITNPSELVLTTVDFRWGELFVQSDQDPSTTNLSQLTLGKRDVIRNIEASFVLPFIARPVEELRMAGKDTKGVFLDGGIKSEIPIRALVDRGVDRAVIVGSSPPRVTPTAAQKNAVAIALRYLDVSLSAVTEGEWEAATPYADYLANFDQRACRDLMKGSLKGEARSRFCRGEIEAACSGVAGTSRKFAMLGIFRRETVDPTFGYSFAPNQMRRLFNAGAEQVRTQCADAAGFLGITAPTEEIDRWCNETPVADGDLAVLTQHEGGEAELCTH